MTLLLLLTWSLLLSLHRFHARLGNTLPTRVRSDARTVPSARRRQILVAPRSVTNASEVVIRARLVRLCASLARPVNFKIFLVRPHVICVKKLRTLVVKQETGHVKLVR